MTFNHTTVGAVTADYYWKMRPPTASSTLRTTPAPASRKVFRQDDGGLLMGIAAFLDVDYWLHR